MNEDGLGTLAVLPCEVRDMIFGHVVREMMHKHPWTGNYRPYPFSIRRESATQTSSQFRREFLEAYLREGDFFEPCYNGEWALDLFLSFMHPLADIATHIRHIGIAVYTNMFEHYDWDCYFSRPGTDLTVQREISRRAEQLWCYHEHYNIPSHRLYIVVGYNRPLSQEYEDEDDLLDCLHNDLFTLLCFFLAGIKVYMGCRETSIALLDRQCQHTQETLYAEIDSFLTDLSDEATAIKVEKEPERWPVHVALLRQARAMIPKLISDMRECHMALIDKLMDYWQVKNDMEEFCLGDFFALAEAW
ncbi:hypothetical protein KCU67_g8082, partial [Aureobasidium melanogenum]